MVHNIDKISLVNIEFFRQNSIGVNIYLKDLILTTIHQVPSYGPSSFFSSYKPIQQQMLELKTFSSCYSIVGDIGGAMGLCFGASIFTLIEIIIYFITVLISKFKTLINAKHPENTVKPLHL